MSDMEEKKAHHQMKFDDDTHGKMKQEQERLRKNGRHASFSDAFRELYKDAMNFRARAGRMLKEWNYDYFRELSELHVDRNAMSILKDWMSNAEQEGIEKPNISSGIRYAQSRIEQLVVLLYREGKGEKL